MNIIDDPEVLAFIAKTESFYPADSNLCSAEENRRRYDIMCVNFLEKRPEGIIATDKIWEGVPVRCYEGENFEKSLPKIIYMHGGGFVVGSLESHDDVCAEIADFSKMMVISVDYRLAPEHMMPAQLDDVETVWNYVYQNISTNIILAGDSAGANLSAGLCVRLNRKKQALPIKQVLIYPGLGGNFTLPSYTENAEAPLLRAVDLRAYSQRDLSAIPKELLVELAPLNLDDYSFFPPTAVFTADVDPIRDDGIEFAKRLNEAGVVASVRNDAQLVHGYLRGRHMSKRIATAFDKICEAIVDVD